MTAMTMTKQRLDSPPRSGDVNSREIIPYLNLSQPYRDAIETVRRLAQLPYDWDSYGSRPLEPAAVAAAANALEQPANPGYLRPLSAPCPEAACSLSGPYVTMTWNWKCCPTAHFATSSSPERRGGRGSDIRVRSARSLR